MWKDFKAFIARGNVLDLAVGVIIGAAFTTIVKTFTDGIIMPFVGILTGNITFKEKAYDLATHSWIASADQLKAATDAKDPLVLYGQFINDVITFLIVAFVMFLLARYAVKLFRGLEASAVPTPEVELLTEIRDLLKTRA